MNTVLYALEQKKLRLESYQPYSVDLESNFREWFKIELTYTSNAIEGNTLSRAETALIVEKGLTVEGKTLQEHLEAVNHAQAFEWIIQHQKLQRQSIDEGSILELHHLILQKIDDVQAGRYRTVPVRIAGSRVILPNALKVPHLMTDFISWLHTSTDSAAQVAVDAHLKLVSIHPFTDGNGRTARLLMNLLLLQAGFPPAVIRKEDRLPYVRSLEKLQLGGSPSEYYTLMYKAIDRSLEIYLNALEGHEQMKLIEKKDLLKIGELATLVGEPVPTIRHWTNQGLLQVAEYSSGGYQLYDQSQAAVVKLIRKFQEEDRLTISEIKRVLSRK